MDTRNFAPIDIAVTEQAAEWMLALKESAVTRADKEAFSVWLRRSPVHVEEFLRVSSLDVELFGRKLDIDVEALLGAGGSSAAVEILPSVRPRQQVRPGIFSVPRKLRRAALAASVIAAVGVVVAIAGVYALRSASAYMTDRGEQRSISLPDGSLMELNTQTSARVVYTKASRKIILAGGEALFTVAKNPNRPFIVEAGASSIRATGTRFNVAERGARTVVTVVEGSVAVMSDADAVHLAAGQQLEIRDRKESARRAPAPVHAVDPARATAWQQWKLYFDDASLGEAVAEFNRYNQQQLAIDDPVLAGRRISGVFFANQPDSLISFIASRDALEVRQAGEGKRVLRLK